MSSPFSGGYTSQTCFNCGLENERPKQHFVVCPKCGKLHSDTNRAMNILKLGLKLKSLEWNKVKEVHLIWKFGKTNQWIFKYLRIYEKDKDKLLVRERANNPPVRWLRRATLRSQALHLRCGVVDKMVRKY